MCGLICRPQWSSQTCRPPPQNFGGAHAGVGLKQHVESENLGMGVPNNRPAMARDSSSWSASSGMNSRQMQTRRTTNSVSRHVPFRSPKRSRSVQASAADKESRGRALWRGSGPARGPAETVGKLHLQANWRQRSPEVLALWRRCLRRIGVITGLSLRRLASG